MMPSRCLLAALLLLGACAGGTQYTTLTASPSAGPAAVIDCVRSQFGKLDYQQVAYDVQGHRVVAKKTDNKVARADPQFIHLVNQIEATATTEPSGTGLRLVAHTIGRYSTHRGPTDVEEKASPQVKQDAETLLQACGRP
ncbi:MAG TPA: hypothetical protein VI297_07830 [Gemmatimonadales bacterium]